MKKTILSIGVLLIILNQQFSYCQSQNKDFGLFGVDNVMIKVNQTFSTTSEIFPFDKTKSSIFGLALKANITLNSESSLVRLILIDKNYEEYLIYEAFPLIESSRSYLVDDICEETSILNSIIPLSVRIEITDAAISIKSFTFATSIPAGTDVRKVKKEKKQAQNKSKIDKINKSLIANGLSWVAGPTAVSELSYSDKKQLFGQSNFPPWYQYYSGGVIQTGNTLKTSTSSLIVDNWDWRNRHGQNWITSIKDQSSCGSCWAFAATGTTEAIVNVFFNQHLDLDLSEQEILSCSGAGSCLGGSPGNALNYISKTGIIDETTFPYLATDLSCDDKPGDSNEWIKIGGKIDFGTRRYAATNDNLKKMIIEKGPISSGLYDWSHAMVLVGYQVMKEGDSIFYRDLSRKRYWKIVLPGDPLIGKLVWIFKNSHGINFGDDGYVYVETDISNIGWTHALLSPVESLKQPYEVQCLDNDGDGYFWWGIGNKPDGCDCPDLPDGDDSNPELGPLDEFGNCTILSNNIVAAFSATDNNIIEGGIVTFTDGTSNNPTSLHWTFSGGNPSSSTSNNPTICYEKEGIYSVILQASNELESDECTKIGFVVVEKNGTISYCSSHSNSNALEWISQVDIGSFSNPSGASNFSDYTTQVVNLAPGSFTTLTLTPHFTGTDHREFWKIWIDFNKDGDFEDPGETVLRANSKKSVVHGSISIPGDVFGTTRMRISMKNGSPPKPCEFFEGGEVEDYIVNFIDGASKIALLPNGKSEFAEIEKSFVVYPNPASDILFLQFKSWDGEKTVRLIDMFGKSLFTQSVTVKTIEIDISNYPKGIYFLDTNDGIIRKSQKISIQ